MDFTKTFKAKSGIELYEHIIVREENGAQCVYTIMNESCFEILKKTLLEFQVNVQQDVDFTENFKELYRSGRLCEFVYSNDTLSPSDFISHFYSKHIKCDEVLEKIYIGGINSLDKFDRQILTNFNTSEAKKSA